MTKLLLSVVLASAAFTQVGTQPPFQPPGPGGPEPSLALRQYLDLTNQQVSTMLRLRSELVRFQSEKLRRQVQVNMEISQEMRRETLDPMAIGLRFVELEAIRREIAAEQARITREVQALLTPAQRTRIQALQDVLRTYPLACEALFHNLMSPPQEQGQGQGPGQMPGGGMMGGPIGSFIFGAPVCGGIGFGSRTGDFTGVLIAPPPDSPMRP